MFRKFFRPPCTFKMCHTLVFCPAAAYFHKVWVPRLLADWCRLSGKMFCKYFPLSFHIVVLSKCAKFLGMLTVTTHSSVQKGILTEEPLNWSKSKHLIQTYNLWCLFCIFYVTRQKSLTFPNRADFSSRAETSFSRGSRHCVTETVDHQSSSNGDQCRLKDFDG